MKRLIALLLTVATLLIYAFALTACAPDLPIDFIPDTPEENEQTDGDTPSENPLLGLIIPEYRDHERGTLNFDEIKYSRPDADKLISNFSETAGIVRLNEISFDEQVAVIDALDADYTTFSTMYAYSNIMMSHDVADQYWVDEYTYISGKTPSLIQAIESLYVAAAQSVHAESFEQTCFGDWLIEEYADGGSYTDEIIALMDQETELENLYSSLSPSTVIIEYKNLKTTLENILAFYAENYGESSASYNIAEYECTQRYEAEVERLTRYYLVELVKVRRLIADKLGYKSYATYAYENIYHDYSEEDALKFMSDISKYVVPVYQRLAYYVFMPYFLKITDMPGVDTVTLMNNVYSAYSELDAPFADIYAYMLQHELFDISKDSETRYDGSFCTYLDDYSAPYIFITTTGQCDDYATLAHEFGHFTDAYINYDSQTSLDLSEVSSTALEFLTLLMLEDSISEEEYKYLTYSQLYASLQTLIYQGFYAMFEHNIYNLKYDEITEERLIKEMQDAAESIGLSPDYFTTLDNVTIPHILLYPFYVQSYCTSTAVALTIYYTEKNSEGEGLEAYIDLVTREDSEMTFEQHLSSAGLASPFTPSYLKVIMDGIHYDIMGSHYFNNKNEGNAA